LVKRGPVKGNIGVFIKGAGRTSWSFEGACPWLVKFVGNPMESAYHGPMMVNHTAAILVEGADKLQGCGHLSIRKGFLVIDPGP